MLEAILKEKSQEVILRVDQVSKRIGKQVLLHPCSFQVERGEVLALCGGNGAGKSTLLRMLAGLSQPSGGHIHLNDRSWLQGRKAYADSIGYMPDDFNFGTALTGFETLRFYASLRGVSDIRIADLLELVGLFDVRNRKVAAYSKGMRQRLLFAQALLADPELLLLDEPTNGLDPYWMEAFGDLVKQTAEAGHTVVFSTHQLNVAERIADQVIFLDAGHVRYSGSAQLIKEQYPDADGLYGVFRELIIQEASRERREEAR